MHKREHMEPRTLLHFSELEPPAAPHDQPDALRIPRRAAAGESIPAMSALESTARYWIAMKSERERAEAKQRRYARAAADRIAVAVDRREKLIRFNDGEQDRLTALVMELRTKELRAFEHHKLAEREDARLRLLAMRDDTELARSVCVEEVLRLRALATATIYRQTVDPEPRDQHGKLLDAALE